MFFVVTPMTQKNIEYEVVYSGASCPEPQQYPLICLNKNVLCKGIVGSQTENVKIGTFLTRKIAFGIATIPLLFSKIKELRRIAFSSASASRSLTRASLVEGYFSRRSGNSSKNIWK